MAQSIIQQPPPRIHRSPGHWQSIVDQFETSGLTQHAFCQQEEIAFGTFSRWRRRLMTPDQPPVFAAPNTDLFVELSTGASPPATTPAWDVELQLGHDVFLRLRHQPC